ncbi:MAG: hypothetical protein ABIN67_16390 [Ferruginibacter sp.]
MSYTFCRCINHSPVTGLPASFGSVRRGGLKKERSDFFKEAKAAAFRLRRPPAVEAKPVN